MRTVGWNWRGEDGYMHNKDDSASTAPVKTEECPSALYLRKAIRIGRGKRVKKKEEGRQSPNMVSRSMVENYRYAVLRNGTCLVE